MKISFRGAFAALGLLLLAGVAHAAPRLAISPLGYQVVQLQGVPGNSRAFDVTSRVGVTNLGDPANGITATLSSSSQSLIVLDGEVTFGTVTRTPLLRPVISRDTFTLRIVLPQGRKLGDLLQVVHDIHTSLKWTLSCSNCGNANRPPVANAGTDQTVYVAQTVTLDGSASSDPDGQALQYAWTFVSRPAGSQAVLASATSVRPTFVPDREGDYVVRLIVSDGTLSSGADTVQISTLNSAPMANAGADFSAIVGQRVVLDGSASSDTDGDPLTYAWSIVSAPAGSSAAIVDPAQVLANFTPDLAGQYVFELVVDDGTVSSAPDTVTLSTMQQNRTPVANAGADQSVSVGGSAQLDGSASSDADGDPLTFAWALNSQPSGSLASLQGANTSAPSLQVDVPGTYVAQLIVSDGQAPSTPDTVSISTVNTPPVARISPPAIVVKWGSAVELDGSSSADADGDPLAFRWSILTRPGDSQADFVDSSLRQVTFTADRPGIYVVQLVANDGFVPSDAVTVTVTATNEVPDAVDDVETTQQGIPVQVQALANDTDADDDPLTIVSITQPSHGTASAHGTFIRYFPASGFSGTDSLSYTVSDGAATSTANVTITVAPDDDDPPPTNRAPVAAAGADLTADVGDAVSLNGAASSDPDGDAITYSWSIVAGPGGGASLSASSVSNPTITATLAGEYTVQLVVSDGQLNSTPDEVVVSFQAIAPPADSDGDGLSDAEEQQLGTDPSNPDTDGDVLTDFREVRTQLTNPRGVDTDGDSFWDADEIVAGTDPTNAMSLPAAPGVTTGPTSDALIEAALASGTVTPEQALLYKVFAVQGDPRLPAEYRGAPSGQIDSGIMIRAARELPNLSPEAQAIIATFLLPPQYERGSGLALASAPSSMRALAAADAAANAVGPCRNNQFYELIATTGHAKVWMYRHDPGQADASMLNAIERQAGTLAAQYIDQIWTAVTGTFGRVPPSDASVGSECNGGDGALDIYVKVHLDSEDPTRLAQAVPYLAGCQMTPSFIELKAFTDPKKIRNALAHEFFHTLQLGAYSLFPNCEDYDWLGEATGNWVMDHVYHGDNVEQPYAGGYMVLEHKVPVDEAANSGTQGYSDYVFLQYLAESLSPATIAAIWNAAESTDSPHALAAGVGGNGTLEDLWHLFSQDAWNDHAESFHDDFDSYDDLKDGIKAAFSDADGGRANRGDPSTKARLEGEQTKQFELLRGASQIKRLSFLYDYVKFDDPAVRYIRYEAPITSAQGSEFELTAYLKINGEWTEEDWTDVRNPSNLQKLWCRDKNDENLEELVLVYSNGQANPDAPPIDVHTKPKISVSNGGCFRWAGTSRVRIDHPNGGSFESSARVTLEVEPTDFDINGRFFTPVNGTAEVVGALLQDTGCTQVYVRNATAIGPNDARPHIDLFGSDGEPLQLRGGGLTSVPNTTFIIRCEGHDVFTANVPIDSQWLSSAADPTDLTGAPLSSDGQHIQGGKTYTNSVGIRTSVDWNLSAERE